MDSFLRIGVMVACLKEVGRTPMFSNRDGLELR